MSKTCTIFSLMIGICIFSVSIGANAQERSHRDGDNRDRADSRGHKNDDKKDHHDQKTYQHQNNGNHNHRRGNDRDHADRNYRYHGRDRREVRHVYHHYHNRYCNHAPVVVHHHKRPRYIYYKDYDVYYDQRNSVYITYSGRSWSVSTAIPVGLRYVNVRNTKRYEVDYYDDDFPQYLERRRPSYGSEYQDW